MVIYQPFVLILCLFVCISGHLVSLFGCSSTLCGNFSSLLVNFVSIIGGDVSLFGYFLIVCGNFFVSFW